MSTTTPTSSSALSSSHAGLTARAVIIALVVALPLAVVSYWWRPLTGPILALSGILYTIPSLALLALLAPAVGTTTDASVLIALVLYALLVLVRNSLAGLTQVPAEVRDAAAGMGYGQVRPALADRVAARAARHPDRAAAGHRVHGRPGHGRRDHRQGRPRRPDPGRLPEQLLQGPDPHRVDPLRAAGAGPRPDPGGRRAGCSRRGPGSVGHELLPATASSGSTTR